MYGNIPSLSSGPTLSGVGDRIKGKKDQSKSIVFEADKQPPYLTFALIGGVLVAAYFIFK